MSQNSINKPFDIEERTFKLATEVRLFVKTLEKAIKIIEKTK